MTAACCLRAPLAQAKVDDDRLKEKERDLLAEHEALKQILLEEHANLQRDIAANEARREKEKADYLLSQQRVRVTPRPQCARTPTALLTRFSRPPLLTQAFDEQVVNFQEREEALTKQLNESKAAVVKEMEKGMRERQDYEKKIMQQFDEMVAEHEAEVAAELAKRCARRSPPPPPPIPSRAVA